MEIQYQGVTYQAWEELPPEAKQHLLATLPDNDGNGVPDLLQNPTGMTMGLPTSTQFVLDGQTYDSLSALPASLRSMVQSALQQAGTGPIANMWATHAAQWAEPGAPVASHHPADSTAAWAQPAEHRVAQPSTVDPGVITESRSRGGLLALVMLALIVAAVVLMLAYR